MAAEARTHHEEPAVATRRVLLLVGGFVAFVVVLVGVLGTYYRAALKDKTVAATLRDFPAPRLQPNPTQDYVNVHAAQVRQLEGYAWADRTAGLAHIPIERAMALVAARGPAAYDPVEGTPVPSDPGAPLDGAPRAVSAPSVAPYGAAP